LIKFLHNPTTSTRITSPYGYRKHPVTNKYTGHNGIDIGATKRGINGDKLYAVADGEVIISKVNGGGIKKGYGYYIVVQHNGFATLYGHQMSLIVKVGQRVKAGQLIGYMGNTGTSTATHLHFGVTEGNYWNMKWINPALYLLNKSEKVVDSVDKDIKDINIKNIKELTVKESINIIQEKAGLDDNTIQFLLCYKWADSLVKKLASGMNE